MTASATFLASSSVNWASMSTASLSPVMSVEFTRKPSSEPVTTFTSSFLLRHGRLARRRSQRRARLGRLLRLASGSGVVRRGTPVASGEQGQEREGQHGSTDWFVHVSSRWRNDMRCAELVKAFVRDRARTSDKMPPTGTLIVSERRKNPHDIVRTSHRATSWPARSPGHRGVWALPENLCVSSCHPLFVAWTRTHKGVVPWHSNPSPRSRERRERTFGNDPLATSRRARARRLSARAGGARLEARRSRGFPARGRDRAAFVPRGVRRRLACAPRRGKRLGRGETGRVARRASGCRLVDVER